jgi:hypothetical protein
VCLLVGIVFATSARAQNICDQTALFPRPIPLGISGSNLGAFGAASGAGGHVCFVGTLGSLVQDGSGNQYILSNNHVIAKQNRAVIGAPIVEPGLGDQDCKLVPANKVARLSKFVRIDFRPSKLNDIDGAIAKVIPGRVDPQGTILNIGEISSTPLPSNQIVPGLMVRKMGRTSCVTTGMIQATNVLTMVSYERAFPVVANFQSQIAVTGAFGVPGDSGSLVVTSGPCPQPVGLLFAGGGNMTFLNPIPAVLSELGVSFVQGSQCSALTASTGSVAPEVATDDVGIKAATSVRDNHLSTLTHIPGAVGNGISVDDATGAPDIVVYVEKLTPAVQAAAPTSLDGTAVKLIETGKIVAY